VRRLRRCAHSPKRDHDDHAQGIPVTLISRRPLGLQGTRGGPGAAPGPAAGAEAAGHVATSELPRAGQRELEPQGTWRPRLGSGSWSRRTRGGVEAHLSREARPGLQLAWQRVDTRPAPCLDLELVCGVPGLQGTNIDINRHFQK
jgi:hypothetical protein